MNISKIYPDVVAEDLKYEFEAHLNLEKTIKWAKSLVGYANGEGGTLFIGVSNDGEAFGLSLEEIDKTKNLISVENDRHIFPHVKLNYSVRSIDEDANKYVLAIKVRPSDSIVRYRDGDFNEKVYVKGDGNSTVASPEEIISLAKRKFGVDNESTETLYNEKEWSDYLELCKEFRDTKDVPSIKELQNEEIVSKDGFVKSGFLMFKNDYNGDDTLLCCRLWKGKDKTGEVIDSERLKGSLVSVFENALKFIERNTKTGWKKTENGGRKEIRSYPKEAIREALVNAIAHRDYAIPKTQIDVDIYVDRIEIISPGSWLLPKPYDEYPLGSISSIRRNTIIAACLDVANLMERGGTGFQTMIESYLDAPENIQPVVSIYPGFLNLKLYDKLYRSSVDEEVTDQEKIAALLKSEGPQSVKDLQDRLKYRSRSHFLRSVINPMIDQGIIYRDGKAKSKTSLIRLTNT